MRDWLRLLRVHHWVKNALLAVPYVTAHAWNQPGALVALAWALLSLSLVASATYILNDLADVRHDQAHSAKKHRPLASGAISVSAALTVAVVLFAGGFGLAAHVNWAFLGIVALYTVVTTLYTRGIKRIALLDVVVLASLWVLRLVAGAVAIGVVLSIWLLSFGAFLFLSLSLAKRCAELEAYHGPADRLLPGRGYARRDLPAVLGFGIATGTVSVLVLARFVDSTSAQHEYLHPERLWLLCPPLWFWMARLWLITARGEMHHDPIVYSLKDRASWISLLLFAAVWLTALAPW
jgi:4-hydroxybenzoate polyprenyltransferase